jgi:acyl-CoA synthetase (AMP-forming)/AMP-acid ligase II
MSKYNNIAELLTVAAEQFGDRQALFAPVRGSDEASLTFRELESLSNAYAQVFIDNGLGKGMKTLMMVRPGLEMTAAIFAVFKVGAVPVLIDPGMGMRKMLGCIKNIEPEAFIAVSLAHWISLACSKYFSSIKIRFSLGAMPPWRTGLKRLDKITSPDKIRKASPVKFTIAQTDPDEMAAILFTTGSTGPPKGVIYTHRVYLAQVDIIRQAYGGGPEMIDMSAFPLFAMFAIIMGMPSVIPKMDFTRPAEVDPEVIIKTINRHQISFSFGSPALWRTVAVYCLKHDIKLPTLKKVLMAGAPVSADLHEMVKKIIAPDGETLVPYGATEALPITSFTGSEMLAETAKSTAEGAGYCVGYPNSGLIIKVVECCDDIIPVWNDERELAIGEIGEIMIKGDVVTPGYFNLPSATAMAKTTAGDGQLWHRMGDVGYFDQAGRLFFCGRKAHRVITAERIYYPVCCEAIFNRHQKVFRTALVGQQVNGSVIPVLFIELHQAYWTKNSQIRAKIIAELRAIGAGYEFTAEISSFRFIKKFPVDIRHNAKIFREQLAKL